MNRFWCWDEDTDLEPLLQMIEVTTIGSHACSQALGEALSMCSCGSSSEMVCKATFNWSIILSLDWVYGTFPAWCFRCDSPVGSNLESLKGQWFFSMNPEQFACSQSCVHMRHVSWDAVLLKDALTAYATVVPMVVTTMVQIILLQSVLCRSRFYVTYGDLFPSLRAHLRLSAPKPGSFHIPDKTTCEMLKTSN